MFEFGNDVGFAHNDAGFEVLIDNEVGNAKAEWSPSPAVVFIDKNTGYVFYTDETGGGDLVYQKTTNRGVSWGDLVTLDSNFAFRTVSVWYDNWTPGSYSGTEIHIAYANNNGIDDDLWYMDFDTNGDNPGTITKVADGI